MENILNKINIIEFVRYICWKKNISVSHICKYYETSNHIFYGSDRLDFNADTYVPRRKTIYKLIEALSLTPEEFRFLFLLYNTISYDNPLNLDSVKISVPGSSKLFQYNTTLYTGLELELIHILENPHCEAYKFMKNYKSYKTFNKKTDKPYLYEPEAPTAVESMMKVTNESKTEAFKTDSNKPDVSLFPLSVIENVTKVFESGLKKYPRDNWKGLDKQRVLNALKRHLIALETEELDKESGLPHIDHIACNATMLVYLNNQND